MSGLLWMPIATAIIERSGIRSTAASLTALVQHRRRGVVLVVEVEGIVIALGEGRVAHDGEIAGHPALELHLDGAAVAPLVEDDAGSHAGFDVLTRDLDQEIGAPRGVALADLVLGVGSDNREIVVAESRQQGGCKHDNDRPATSDGEHDATPQPSNPNRKPPT